MVMFRKKMVLIMYAQRSKRSELPCSVLYDALNVRTVLFYAMRRMVEKGRES